MAAAVRRRTLALLAGAALALATALAGCGDNNGTGVGTTNGSSQPAPTGSTEPATTGERPSTSSFGSTEPSTTTSTSTSSSAAAATAPESTEAFPSIETPVSASSVPTSAITLGSDGLGIVTFGEPADTAAALLIDRLGPPSSDSSYTPPGPAGVGCFVATGYGCDEYFRGLSWEGLGLSVVLIDVSPYRSDGAPHFAGWHLWERAASSPLRTSEGVGLGATIADLLATYGDRLELSPWLDPCDIEESWEFRIDGGMVGSLSGPPDVTTTYVTELYAGLSSSC